MSDKRMAAAAEGKLHYEGRPCKNCGSTVKYTSSANCVDCVLERSNNRHNKVRELIAQAKAGA